MIDAAALEAGRDAADIRRLYNVPGEFVPSPPAPASDNDEAVVGPPEHWSDVLTHLALDYGFSTFALIAPPDPKMLHTFIDEVAPQVRDRVAVARG